MSALKNKGIYALDPESANGYSLVAAVTIGILVVGVQSLGWMNLFYSIPLAMVSVHDLGGDLVAVRATDDSENSGGSACAHCGAGISGVPESRR